MKRIFTLLFLITILTFTGSINKSFAESEKHALIIAIGDYDRSATGWSAISSKNDIPLIKTALMGQGFEEKNIAILEDQDADKLGIINALDDLYKSVDDDDYVVIHYSGHGQQISDNENRDEIDGLDEALVSIKAPSKYMAGENYTGEEHLRDEELGSYIDKIRGKVGKEGQVLVILDACHSGTGTRGISQVRGGEGPLIIPGESGIEDGEEEKGFGMSETSKSRGDSENIAPFVLFAGSKFDEPNYETKDENGNGVGSLSFALAKSFSEINTNSTYSSVFARILEIMSDIAPKQTPMIEGDINYKVFNGEVVEQEYYYLIDRLESENSISITGGNVTGVSVGDKVGLYSSGTHSIDDETSALSGVVKETNNFDAVVEFDSNHNIVNLKSYWVFIEEYNLENSYMGIFLEGLDTELNTILIDKLDNINNISRIVYEADEADILITTKPDIADKNTRGNSYIYVKSIQNGDIIRSINPAVTIVSDADNIAETVKDYTQGMFIKNIELSDENYRVELEFIPVIPAVDENGNLKTDEYGNYIVKDTLDIADYTIDGNIEFSESDVVMIKITNTGNDDSYFSIIDIQPDGVINQFYPVDNIKPEECFVEEGNSFIPRDFIINGFGEPFGKEVIKIFANADEIDLSPIITTRGKGTRGVGNSLGLVVTDSYATRGPKPKTGTVSNKDTGSSIMYPFTIKKDQ